jgi:hypothetical protein
MSPQPMIATVRISLVMLPPEGECRRLQQTITHCVVAIDHGSVNFESSEIASVIEVAFVNNQLESVDL